MQYKKAPNLNWDLFKSNWIKSVKRISLNAKTEQI